MRYRESTSPEIQVSGAYKILRDNGVWAYNQEPFNDVTYRSYGRFIHDDPRRLRGYDGYGGRTLVFKGVLHAQWSGDFTGSKLSYHFPGSPGGWVYDLDTRYFTTAGADGKRDVHGMALDKVFDRIQTVAPDNNVYFRHFERWQKVQPSMTTRTNAAVFLGELRDIKRMVDILPKKHFNLRNWRDVFRYANGGHLNYQFGWKPYFRDLKNVGRSIESFDRRFLKFKQNQLKPITRHATDNAIENTATWSEPAVGLWTREYTSSVKVTNASTFKFDYKVPNYGSMRLRAWLDTFGLHLNPQNVWALMPWSFVVDWSMDVSSQLSQFNQDWTQPEITLSQSCASRLVEAEVACDVKGPAAWGSPRGKLYTIKFREYQRGTGCPNFRWDLQSLDTDRIRLLASLVASRVV